MQVIDSRDLAARLNELEDQDEDDEPLDEEELEERDALRELSSAIPEWHDGATLIPESSFQDYAREFAEDIGAIPDGAGWPCTCIDWEQTARELAMDYTSVEHDGDTYYVHA